MGFLYPRAALPTLHLYCESVRLPVRRTVSLPLFGLSTASTEIEPALPSSCINPLVTRRGLRPRHVSPRSPYRVVLFRLQQYGRPSLRASWSISGLNPFTCITTGSLHPLGSPRFVTSPRARFCSELVVSLYSCWTSSSVNADFLGAPIYSP